MSLAEKLRAASYVIHSVFIYAALTKAGFVKVGLSRTPFDRIYQVHVGSPSPVEACQWVWVGSLHIGRQIERDVRKVWKARHTRGEWFLFDYKDPADKRAFHDELTAVVAKATKRDVEWNKLGPGQTADLLREAWERQQAKPRGRPNERHPWRSRS